MRNDFQKAWDRKVAQAREQGREVTYEEAIRFLARIMDVSVEEVPMAILIQEKSPEEFARLWRGETTVAEAYLKVTGGALDTVPRSKP